MKIGEIREIIDRLNWTRSDLSGATREEFKRMNVPARFEKPLAACQALEIAPMFKRDITDCNNAIERAKAMIFRWYEAQAVETEGGAVQ